MTRVCSIRVGSVSRTKCRHWTYDHTDSALREGERSWVLGDGAGVCMAISTVVGCADMRRKMARDCKRGRGRNWQRGRAVTGG